MEAGAGFGAGGETSVLVSVFSAEVDGDVRFVLTAAAVRISDLTGGGAVSSAPASAFNKRETSEAVVSFLEFCPSPTVSDVVVESFLGRPLLRFGERGAFPSSLGDVGCGEGLAVLSCSGNLRLVFGGRPLFLFKGVTREFTLESAEDDVVSLPGAVSVFLDWFPPRPRPR